MICSGWWLHNMCNGQKLDCEWMTKGPISYPLGCISHYILMIHIRILKLLCALLLVLSHLFEMYSHKIPRKSTMALFFGGQGLQGSWRAVGILYILLQFALVQMACWVWNDHSLWFFMAIFPVANCDKLRKFFNLRCKPRPQLSGGDRIAYISYIS